MKGTILALAVAGALMLAGCGGGSKTATMSGDGGGGGVPVGGGPGGEPIGGPSGGGGGIEPPPVSRGVLLDKIDAWHDAGEFWHLSNTFGSDTEWIAEASVRNEYGNHSGNRPYRIEEILEDANHDYPGQRFSGTSTLEDRDGNPYPSNFWGGWIDNAIFIAEYASTPGIVSLGVLGDRMSNREFRDHDAYGIGPSSPFSLSTAYRGRAVDSKGNWADATLRLNLTNYYGIADAEVDDPTATLSLDFSPRINFPPIRAIPVVGLWTGVKFVRGEDSDIGPVGEAEAPYLYVISFAPFEGGIAGRAQIAGSFRRLHMAKQDPASQSSSYEHGDRSQDRQGVFGVTPDDDLQ